MNGKVFPRVENPTNNAAEPEIIQWNLDFLKKYQTPSTRRQFNSVLDKKINAALLNEKQARS